MSVNEKPLDADDQEDRPLELHQYHAQKDLVNKYGKNPDADWHQATQKNVPERLRGAAEENIDAIEQLFLEALKTDRSFSARCPGCNKTVPVVIPDWTARLNALKMLLERGYGMPGKAEEPVKPPPERATMTELEAMTNSELAAYISARRG